MGYYILGVIILGLLFFIFKYFLENEKYKNTLNGEMQKVDPNGTLSICHYKKGVKYGEHRVLDRHGNIKLLQNYNSKGKLDGPAVEYNYKGILISEGVWKENKKIGVWKEYFDDGTLKSIKELDDNSNRISSIAYYSNGQLWFEHRDNFENSYYKNGVLKRRLVFRTKWHDISDLTYYKENYENSNLKEERIYKYENYDECYQTLYYENGFIQGEGKIKVSRHRNDCMGRLKLYDKHGNLYK